MSQPEGYVGHVCFKALLPTIACVLMSASKHPDGVVSSSQSESAQIGIMLNLTIFLSLLWLVTVASWYYIGMRVHGKRN